MRLTVQGPSPVPPRELEEAQLTHRGLLLRLTVLRVAGVRKDGEVRYKRHTTEYVVERPRPGEVVLVKDDGRAYTVTEWGCDCEDASFKGRERQCKHWTGCVAVGLLGACEGTA